MLHGMTGKEIQDIVPLAKSWVNPAHLNLKSAGFTSIGYDPAQMAYVLEKESGSASALELTLEASEESPVVNPAIVIRGCGNDNFELVVNNEKMTRGKDYRCGVENRLDRKDMILWLNTQSSEPLSISLSH